MSNRDLGEMGEATLKTWTAQVGVTANKAGQDKRGWDFILEFPTQQLEQNMGSFDRVINPIQCFVQVKSTDNNSGSLAVKLSNWVRLVNTDLPAFFLVLDFDGENNCQKAYLIHIYEDEIRKVLKRLRELSSKIDSGKLNKKTLNLNWNEDNLIPSLDGNGLVKSIKKNTNNFKTYSTRKHDLIENVGYENERGKFNVNFSIPDSYKGGDFGEFWVDFSLGLTGGIKINSGEIWDMRFGISAPKPEKSIGSGSIIKATPKPILEDILLMRENESGNEIRIPVKVFVPSGVKEVAKEKHLKMLFKFPEGHIIIVPSQSIVKYNINIPDGFENYPFKELNLIAKIILFMFETEGEIEFYLGTDSLGKGGISESLLPEEFYKWAKTIRNFSEIANSFDIFDQLIIKPIELWQEKDKLEIMKLLINEKEYKKKKLRFGFNCDSDISVGENFCVPHVTNMIIGQYNLIVVLGYLGQTVQKDELHNLDYLIEVEDIKILRKQALNRGEELPKPVSTLIKEVKDSYKEDYNILNIFNNSDE